MKWQVLVFLCVCGLPAFAQEEETPFPEARTFNDPLGLGFKNFQYFLGFKVEEWFDDNITLAKSGEESDLITVITPDVKLSWERNSRNFASLAYKGRGLFYSSHTEFSGLEHILDLVGHITIGRVWFEVGDSFKARKDPFDTLQLVGRLDTNSNRFWFTTALDWTKFDIELTYAVEKFWFDDSSLDSGDFRRNEFSVRGGTEVLPNKTIGFLEVRFTNTQYAEQVLSDFDTIRLAFGVKGQPTEKVAVNGRIGMTRAQTDDNGAVEAHDFSGLMITLGATWDIDAEQTLKLELVRQPIESFISGLAITAGITVDYEQKFTERITGTAGFGVERQEESTNSDDRLGWNLRAGGKYDLGNHFTLDAWLQYRTKSSEDGLFEYDNFRGYVGVGAAW